MTLEAIGLQQGANVLGEDRFLRTSFFGLCFLLPGFTARQWEGKGCQQAGKQGYGNPAHSWNSNRCDCEERSKVGSYFDAQKLSNLYETGPPVTAETRSKVAQRQSSRRPDGGFVVVPVLLP